MPPQFPPSARIDSSSAVPVPGAALSNAASNAGMSKMQLLLSRSLPTMRAFNAASSYPPLPACADAADATGNEPIFDLAGQPAGKVSSGAYGYHVGQSLALAYLRPDIAAGLELSVMVLGQPHRARVLEGAAFDPEGKRLRQ